MTEKTARLRWQCRRGMLELDAILQPFFEEKFQALSLQQQEDFEAILAYPDQELFAWFIGSKTPKNPSILRLVEIVKAFREGYSKS